MSVHDQARKRKSAPSSTRQRARSPKTIVVRNEGEEGAGGQSEADEVAPRPNNAEEIAGRTRPRARSPRTTAPKSTEGGAPSRARQRAGSAKTIVPRTEAARIARRPSEPASHTSPTRQTAAGANTMVVRSESEAIGSRPSVAARDATRAAIPWIRAGAGLVLVTGAYYSTLAALFKAFDPGAAPGYLGLIPLISLILIATRALAPHTELDIHDRYSDYIIGIALLMVAVGTVVIAPISLSTLYAHWRIDLLSLPFFVAGMISIIFGLRALWRVRLGVLFLFLAWPFPYIAGQLQALTNLTLGLIHHVLQVAPLAQPLASSDGSLFSVPARGSAFVVSIGAASSGLNNMVGFLLVAVAFAALVRGRLLAKMAWLVCGLLLVWTLDLARILIAFAAGPTFGERFALGVLHPVMALLVFSLGLLGIIGLLPFFKLRLEALSRGGARPAPRHRPAVKRARVALTIVGAAALVTAVAGIRPHSISSFSPRTSAAPSGIPRVVCACRPLEGRAHSTRPAT